METRHARHRAHRGRRNYHDGLAAEEIAERAMMVRGAHPLERRWRGKAGEIDLILREGDVLVFVEVKKADTIDEAATRLTAAQIARVASAAEEYAARFGDDGAALRIDGALVDAAGRCEILENISVT